ncbi:hypothetical protein F4824DRAFT_459665 [Ustulina deusta]|nr:hypothetical protein F4823DRAFT_598568 [Ustulina deusta]KAI3338567.1 hypothetical protein F4824DRAFT_459665 [Ustulina deusta]
MSSNQTCDITAIPSFESLPLPRDIIIGALSTRNDTLTAMQNCCLPNPVNSIGDCLLWCEIPGNSTGAQWLDCIHPYIIGHYGAEYGKTGSMAPTLRPSTMGIATIALFISGLYVW